MNDKLKAYVKDYFDSLFQVSRHGDAREESYYSSLATLVKQAAIFHKKKGVDVTTLPKQTEAGNPDFRVWDSRSRITGYIEAKVPATNLDQVETSDQLKRYLHTFPNVILTDFYEFRLYRNSQRIARVLAGQSFVPRTLKHPSPVKDAEGLRDLLGQFFSFALPRRFTAKTLAVELAKRTRFLRDEVVTLELREQEEKGSGDMLGFYKAFREYLIAELTLEQFADLYAQTVTYGLFAARMRTKGEFNRTVAFDCIPRTIGILRDVFRFISYGEIPEPLKWMVDDITEVLSAANVKRLLDHFYREGKGRDPIVHFYETFLTEYDPTERARRGVYYTPEPVVGYIVRSIHALLKEKFGKNDGLASEGVTLLDPAAGTMTFVAEAARLAVEEYENKYGDGAKAEFIRDHILQNFYAFELMMAPYTVGHLKMSFMLEELGYALRDEDRFKLYLTNTLEFKDLDESMLPGMRSLSEESHMAGKVKKEEPILVILGNPPYSVSSANKSDFIEKEMEIYKEDVRDEKNIQPLSDDYIKFIRFAHWKIDQAGGGVIGMITNNSYISGLIHRGMRKKLLESFNEIYILNLHGNSRMGEKCPDGSKDENVFDIMQGVSIALLIKNEKQKGVGNIYYQDLYGLREDKYSHLNKNDLTTTEWEETTVNEPHHFFIKRESKFEEHYTRFLSITNVFKHFNAGVATGKDDVLVNFDKESLVRKISIMDKKIFSISMETYGVKTELIDRWYEEIKRGDIEKQIEIYAYRPFDNRYTIYNPNILQRARITIMDHMVSDNLGLITTRQLAKLPFNHCLVTNQIADRCLISLRTKEVGYLFPLYLYKKRESKKRRSSMTAMMLFDPQTDYAVKTPNFFQEMVDQLKLAFKKIPSPDEIFFYIYAVVYSNIYRTKYAEFLKIDFPRIPFTADKDVFEQMATMGEELVMLHLLKSPKLNKPRTRFCVPGDNHVAKTKTKGRRYEAKEQRVYINKTQYFDNIPGKLWTYQIGGYQVLDKWLKDRAERRLSAVDIKHYCRVVTALSETTKLQDQLADLYPKVEDNLLTLNANIT